MNNTVTTTPVTTTPVTTTTETTTTETTTPVTTPVQFEQPKLSNAIIGDQNTALNVIVGFISVAQKRGTFSLDESAKIYECIKMFQGVPASN